MIRKSFVMSVTKGFEQEYKKRHDELWKELHDVLKKHGVHNYSIHLLGETQQLFAYAEIESEELWNNIANTEICKKWWKYMGDIMPSNPDNSPISIDLKEVFYMK